MKKLLRCMLSVILVLHLCLFTVLAAGAENESAGADTKAEGLVGVWKVVEMTNNGETVTREQLKSYEERGNVFYMVLKEDRTATIYGLTTEEQQGTWDDSSLIFNGHSAPYTLEGDLFVLEIPGSEMKFERTTIEEIYAILGYKEGVMDESVTYSTEEQVILDTENVLMKVTGYRADVTGFTVLVNCENKSDKKLLVSSDNFVLNKYEIDPSWAVMLDAKQSMDTKIHFEPADLEQCGISAVDELVLRLKVADRESYSFLTEDETVTLYPTGKKPEEIRVEERTPVKDEVIIVDNEECTLILQGPAEKDSIGYSINCYYENKTDQRLTFILDRSSINGVETTVYFAEEALPGTRGYSKVQYMQKSLDDNGIEEVKEIKARLQVHRTDGKKIETIVEEEFTYNP